MVPSPHGCNRGDAELLEGSIVDCDKQMELAKRARHIAKRLRQIFLFGEAGLATSDKLKMLILGYARGHNFGPHDTISRIGQRLFPEIAVRPRLLGGSTLHLDPSDLAQLVVADEVLIEKVYDLDLVPFNPDLILDCGAHIGTFTLLAASKFPDARLIAFEPDQTNLNWLRKQVESNKKNVEVVDAAVFVCDGNEMFKRSASCGGALQSDAARSDGAISVRTVHLARYISGARSERLLLKMDIEGAEELVLPDVVGLLPENCAIFFETHAGDPGWRRAKVLLETKGFAVTLRRWREPYADGFALRRSGFN